MQCVIRMVIFIIEGIISYQINYCINNVYLNLLKLCSRRWFGNSKTSPHTEIIAQSVYQYRLSRSYLDYTGVGCISISSSGPLVHYFITKLLIISLLNLSFYPIYWWNGDTKTSSHNEAVPQSVDQYHRPR